LSISSFYFSYLLSVLFLLFYTQKSIKISVALLAMGHERFSYVPTKSTNAIVTISNFKQLHGESLKDAWFILTKYIVRIQTHVKKKSCTFMFTMVRRLGIRML
jgi:hypothetical protein